MLIKHNCIIIALLILIPKFALSQNSFQLAEPAEATDWPADFPWWKRNNLRVMQTNLPAYEADLDVDSLIADLEKFSVNTLIINGGGIMAFYPTKLDFQYTNPHMQPNMVSTVISKCHDLNIRVITRFDFSRMHRSIFDKHPDWCYISPTGERIINDDMYLASINAPYVQEKSIAIIEELMDLYPIDGIFINMPGYRTNNAYEGTYHGIDQNEHDQQRFADYSGGMTLPQRENSEDPSWTKYQAFKQYTADDWIKNVHDAVKKKNPMTAVCTYMDDFVDIIRHESQTHGLPYWPYTSSDNVNSTVQSHPNHIVSNASIQQISFRSRYNAIEPEETVIRLYENLANGSGLDMSLMGDFRDYEDERNFSVWEALYAYHERYEPYFGKYNSPAEICLISSGYWPGGTVAQECRGIQLMLKEAHLQFDIIEAGQITQLREKIAKYRAIIIPDIEHLSEAVTSFLKERCEAGVAIIGTNRTLTGNEEALEELFGAKIIRQIDDGEGHYLRPINERLFKRFDGQKLVHSKFNLGLYDFTGADEAFLPIYTPGRPGPPEKIGGHQPTGHSGVGMKIHAKGLATLVPINIGRLYYIHGYEQHKNILLDILETVLPSVNELVTTNAHERVEVILQHYTKNIPANIYKGSDLDGMILHLVNLTGFSGNSYFSPLPINNLQFRVKTNFEPSQIYSMASEKSVAFNYKNNYLTFRLDHLGQFDGLIIEK